LGERDLNTDSDDLLREKLKEHFQRTELAREPLRESDKADRQ